MSAPALAARRFGIACLLGCALGVYYGFLRPLRPKRTGLSDFLFLLGGFWVWIYLGFGVCAGDLRLGYTAGLFLGGIVWERTAGRFLRPVYRHFWRVIGKIRDFILLPGKIFLKKVRNFVKFLFATGKKWGTMRKKKRRGGTDHGKKKKTHPVCLSEKLAPSEMRSAGGHRIVYGGDIGSAGSDS